MEAELKQKLNNDLKQALRAGDSIKVSTLRLLLSAIKYAEIARQSQLTDKMSDDEKLALQKDEIARQSQLTDVDILGVIAKEMKQRNESIEAFKQGNRQDLVSKEETELAVLKGYMPQQLTREEIIVEARQTIAEVGAKGIGDKGKVMPRIIARLKGKADGREINNVVTELLSSM